MKKTAVRIIAFLLILAAVLACCNRILRIKDVWGIRNLKKYYELPKDSVDVLIVGGSISFEGVNTGLLWDDRGIAAFDLGGPDQPIWNTYFFLVDALKTQKPKLIILDAGRVTVYDDYATEPDIIKNTYGLRWSYNKIMAMLTSTPKRKRMAIFPEWLRYHYRYSDLSKRDFLKDFGDPMYYDWKGFYSNTNVMPMKGNDLRGVTDVGYMSEKSEWYFNHIIELAQQNDIPIEVVVAPHAGCYDKEQMTLNRAAELAAEKGVSFTNGNSLYEEMGIDYSTDAADDSHLNFRGNIKYTKYIEDNVISKYDIPDHRGDKAYESWERQANYDRRVLSDQEFITCKDADEYFRLISAPGFDGYEVFVSVENIPDEQQELAASVLDALGLSHEDGVEGIWYIKDNDVVWQSRNDDREFFLELPLSDIHLRVSDDPDKGTVNSIIVDHKEKKACESGINIVIYDDVTAKVEDRISILPGNELYRKEKLFHEGIEVERK